MYFERIQALIAEMTKEPGVRVPGERRRANADAAKSRGVDIPQTLFEQLRQLAA